MTTVGGSRGSNTGGLLILSEFQIFTVSHVHTFIVHFEYARIIICIYARSYVEFLHFHISIFSHVHNTTYLITARVLILTFETQIRASVFVWVVLIPSPIFLRGASLQSYEVQEPVSCGPSLRNGNWRNEVYCRFVVLVRKSDGLSVSKPIRNMFLEILTVLKPFKFFDIF